MRWFFLLTVLLNLFYYVWHLQEVPVEAESSSAMALARSERESIRLLSEVADTASKWKSVDDEACVHLGGLSSAQVAGQLQQRLMSLDIPSKPIQERLSTGTDYWVYLPPLASREASLRQLKELQARRVEAYLIDRGDLANGVSLGMFPRKESADAVIGRLQGDGYRPQLRELARSRAAYFLEVSARRRELLSDGLLRDLRVDFPELQIRDARCDGVASQ